MIPGVGKMVKDLDMNMAESNLKKTEAIINSMTRQERQAPDILDASRRRRIAAGSGSTVQDVNQLVKQFRDMQRLMKQMGIMGGRGKNKQGKRRQRPQNGRNFLDMFGGFN
jgi:signal recognition particle subunit SRP54